MGKKSEDKPKRESKAKVHLSSFLITINSQVDDKKYIPKLKNTYEKFYDNVESYIKNKSDGVKIKNISSTSSIERGNKRLAYHLHALLKIEHTGKIHLNLEKMREVFDSDVKGEGKVYFQCKYINDPTFSIQEYFKKEK
jgi:hypothetical protein